MKATSKMVIATYVVVFIALLGGLYFLYTNYQASGIAHDTYNQVTEPAGKGVVGNASLDKDPFDVTISYTDNGFEPSELTVKQGTRVRFLNTSKTTTWPAVGVHPTHTLYPEKENTDCLGSAFDACQDLKSGEFFDFTFYYTGVWPFHDHSHAYNTGTLTVVASTTK